MALQCSLFKDDTRLQSCLVKDSAHVTPGSSGSHVKKIQDALKLLDGAAIADVEAKRSHYGTTTANAVLAFKQKRAIINRAYQSTADNVVGKMTIAALDSELLQKERSEPDRRGLCVLDCSCSRFGLVLAPRSRSFAGTNVGALSPGDDERKGEDALAASRATLAQAIAKLNDLRLAMLRSQLPPKKTLTLEQNKTLGSCNTWLNTNGNTLASFLHITQAMKLMAKNMKVKTSSGGPIEMRRVSDGFHASVDGNPDHGIALGEPFFAADGPLCRRDVITHEFFHFLGVKHGGGALDGPTLRDRITTPQQALNSADNLAQLVSELTTPGGLTDSCAFSGR